MRALALRLTLFIAVGSAALDAHAQGRDDAPQAGDVDALVRHGLALRRERRDAEALDVFRRAYAVAPTPRVLAQMAFAEQACASWIDAERDLTAAQEALGDPWIDANRAILERALHEIRGHLGWLTVDVDGAAEAKVDGRPLSLGAETRVVAQPSVLEVRASGYLPDIRRIDVAPGVRERVRITLVALPSAPASATPAVAPAVPTGAVAESQPRASALPVGPIALGLVGIVGLGIGAYAGVRAIQSKSERDALCAGGPPCPKSVLAPDADARASATASTIAFGVGLTSIAVAAAWWLVGTRRASSSSIAVTPLVGSSAGGIAVWGAL